MNINLNQQHNKTNQCLSIKPDNPSSILKFNKIRIRGPKAVSKFKG